MDALQHTLVSFKVLGELEVFRFICAGLESDQLSISSGLGSGEVILSHTQNKGAIGGL